MLIGYTRDLSKADGSQSLDLHRATRCRPRAPAQASPDA